MKRNAPKRAGGPAPRQGLVLVIVLVVVAVLSLAGYTFTELMVTEHQSAQIVGRQIQTRALVESAADMLRIYLAQTPDALVQSGGVYSNAAQFQGILVVDDGTPRGRGRFSIVAPLVENGSVTGMRYGLENESAKINLNALVKMDKQKPGVGQQLLMTLPGMDASIADAILDFIDDDDTPRENGAESDYYSALTPPYACKNGPLDTIEELLLVRGVTPEILFGGDANRNGIIDSGELGGSQLAEASGADPEMSRGWAAYLTLRGREANVQPDGTPKIDINNKNLQQLHDDLAAVFNDEWTNFILAYRMYGATTQPSRPNSSVSRDSRFQFVAMYQAPPGGGGPPGGPRGATCREAVPLAAIPLAAVDHRRPGRLFQQAKFNWI